MCDDELIFEFEACTLPFDQWTHGAHVKVAYLYVRRYGFEAALERLRLAIKAYNAANKRPESATEGYNETTTHALLHLIAAVAAHYSVTHPVQTGDEFCDMHPQLMSKHALRFFYSPQRRMDPRAKFEFVPPDLTALPRLESAPALAEARASAAAN
jgi:hypothetical protein